jgi:hypothetical protein
MSKFKQPEIPSIYEELGEYRLRNLLPYTENAVYYWESDKRTEQKDFIDNNIEFFKTYRDRVKKELSKIKL